MQFYITNTIGSYSRKARKLNQRRGKILYEEHLKVGVANNAAERMSQYSTVVPNIYPISAIELNKTVALNIESAFKRYLSDKRILFSECYTVSPKQALFFLTRCLTSLGLTVIDYCDKNQNSLPISRLYYLDSIYFGKKIPLFEIFLDFNKKSKKNYLDYKKLKFFDKNVWEKYFKNDDYYFDYAESDAIDDFAKINILYDFMDECDEFYKSKYPVEGLQISVSKQELGTELPSLIFKALSKYYYFHKDNNKVKKYFLVDVKLLKKQIKSVSKEIIDKRGINEYQVLNELRARSILSFDYLYHRDGPSLGKNPLGDPFQLLSSRYYWRKIFEPKKKTEKSLIEPN